MRIAIVNKYAHLTGGADQHCFGLASEMSSRGHEVRFLSTSDEANLITEGVFVPPTVTHWSRDSLSPSEQASVFARALWNPMAAEAMKRLVDDFRPDVIHAHKLYPQLSVAPLVIAARERIPVVQTLHDFEMISASPIDARGGVWDPDETRLRYKLLNSGIRPVHRFVHRPRVTSFIAVSRFIASTHARHGIDAAVFPNFVDPHDDSTTPPPGWDERAGIVFLGRLRPEKGALDVVELARRVPQIPVSVVGSGSLEDEIRHAARTIPNLQVVGFVAHPGLRDVLRRARVVVVPSRWQEPGPLVPLEAMAEGTPVVAYAMGGLGEYVSDSGGGRVVPLDVTALADAARELHDSREVWERLSRRGREAIAERHTRRAYGERLECLYDELRTTRGRA